MSSPNYDYLDERRHVTPARGHGRGPLEGDSACARRLEVNTR